MSATDDRPPRDVDFTDERTGTTFTMRVPPTSPWYDLLETAAITVRDTTDADRAADAAHRQLCEARA